MDASEWAKDEAHATCASCSGSFTFIKRKHHCRVRTLGLLQCSPLSPSQSSSPLFLTCDFLQMSALSLCVCVCVLQKCGNLVCSTCSPNTGSMVTTLGTVAIVRICKCVLFSADFACVFVCFERFSCCNFPLFLTCCVSLPIRECESQLVAATKELVCVCMLIYDCFVCPSRELQHSYSVV